MIVLKEKHEGLREWWRAGNLQHGQKKHLESSEELTSELKPKGEGRTRLEPSRTANSTGH